MRALINAPSLREGATHEACGSSDTQTGNVGASQSRAPVRAHPSGTAGRCQGSGARPHLPLWGPPWSYPLTTSARTLEVLDWATLQNALSEHAATPRGARGARALEALDDREEVELTLDAVDEFAWLDAQATDLQLDAVGDVSEPVALAGAGQVLEPAALREIGSTLAALDFLQRRLRDLVDDVPVLAVTAAAIDLPAEVREVLVAAFDERGDLSAKMWPELGDLRESVASLHRQVREVLEQLVRGDELAEVLQDRYVTQRNDRYVVPVKTHAKRWDIGIVHGTSASGATVYVEPRQVVELNNRLRLVEAALEAEERRILTMLSHKVGAIAEEVEEALGAAAAIDLISARYRFARALGATRPKVGDDGVIDLRGARHPVLLLRGLAVVPNDLSLGAARPVLVLSGPNTGGKTVAMKTIGALALLVRAGCFIPAQEGSRLDYFREILADIGDSQSVQGDLSSFSAHLMAVQEMLSRAAPGALFLLDEIATGTDPTQGAALARAVLEQLATQGPRVVVTTHYASVKGMATANQRFGVAAMEYQAGRPTYRALPGAAGESHGLATAERLGVMPSVVARARALMDSSERELAEALAALDQATSRAAAAEAEARATAAALETQKLALQRREEKLAVRARQLEDEAVAAFRDRIKKANQAISQVVAQLQRDPSHARIQAARGAVAAMEALHAAPVEVVAPPPLSVGCHVRVKSLGKSGEVTQIQGKKVTINAKGLRLQVSAEDLEITSAPPARPAPPPIVFESSPTSKESLETALRTSGNTLDMRGMRADEAIAAAEAFFDRAILSSYDRVFLLHGHGTGALKQAIRQWLPRTAYAAEWSAALPDQGGDAYTVIRLGR